MQNTSGEYEIQLDPEQPPVLQILDVNTQQTIRVTIEEALILLKLMLKHRDELQVLKNGE
jgi:hypothetical protein